MTNLYNVYYLKEVTEEAIKESVTEFQKKGKILPTVIYVHASHKDKIPERLGMVTIEFRTDVLKNDIWIGRN